MSLTRWVEQVIGGDVSTIVYFICSNRIPTTINTNFSRTKEKKESLAHFINSPLRETKQTKKRSSKLESPFPLSLVEIPKLHLIYRGSVIDGSLSVHFRWRMYGEREGGSGQGRLDDSLHGLMGIRDGY